jgi:hypothetical protein
VTGRAYGEALVRKFEGATWVAGKRFAVDEFWGVIDKQAMDNYGSESTAASGIAEWGFRLFEAQKDRRAGINQVKERLLLDVNGNPQIVIYEDRCPEVAKALRSIQSLAPRDPDDYDGSSPYSHALDGLRFLCMEMPVRRERQEHPADAEVARWDALLRKQRELDRLAERRSVSTGYE